MPSLLLRLIPFVPICLGWYDWAQSGHTSHSFFCMILDKKWLVFIFKERLDFGKKLMEKMVCLRGVGGLRGNQHRSNRD
jgi:hypothetical protein